MGFGSLVRSDNGPGGPQALERTFVDALKVVLRNRADDPSRFAADRFEQVEAINAGCTWRARAPIWEEAIRGWNATARARAVARDRRRCERVWSRRCQGFSHSLSTPGPGRARSVLRAVHSRKRQRAPP